MQNRTTLRIRKTRYILTAAALTALLVAPAFAGGPLANCQSGQPFLWPSGGANIPFNPDQGDLGPVDNATAVAQLQEAFDVWGAVASSTATYVNAGPLPVDVDITNFNPFLNPVAPDGLSAIVFDDDGAIFDLLFGPGSGILGFAGPEWINNVTCEVLEGVSFLNGPSFTNATAAKDVMVHEFGHYSNLAHTVVNGQTIGLGDSSGPSPVSTFLPIPAPADNAIETMYPFYFGPTSGTQSLHADDIASLSTLYPAPGFAASTAAISGTILAPNGATKLSGVNVIARNVADPFRDAVSAISGDFTEDFSQGDAVAGTFVIEGLTPGADYAIFVDQILQGGFSTAPLSLPGPEEFWNGAAESSDPAIDDPQALVTINVAAGATAAGTDIIFNGTGPGQIDLGDDDTEEIFLPFAYEICGQTFNSVFVNSNGSLTFGSGDTDFSESIGEFLGEAPRIAGLWDDLNPSAGGTISFSESSNTFSVLFDAVPEFFSTGANTFEITLKRASNHINIDYGAISAADGLAGVSCGGAVTSGFETESDLSAFGPSRINLHNQTAVYELFGAGEGVDLANSTVRFNGTTNYNDNWAEPNDSLGHARNISLPFDSIDVGRFTEIEPVGGDVDFYAFNAPGGNTLVAEIVSGALDTVLGLFDNAGNLLAADDDGGSGVLSKIQVEIPANGTYFLAVSTFPDFGFTGAGGSGGRYVLDAFAINGVVLDLGDDDSEEVALGFSFPFQGTAYTSVFVNSNGSLTFGSGDTDFSESVSELLSDQPRIAALWDDLSPNNGGQVLLTRDAGSATVSFVGVPEFVSTGSNSFDITLAADGTVTIAYGAVSATDGLVGVTPGGGSADPGETDLSAALSLSVNGTTYEQFGTGDAFDLSGAVLTFNP